MALARAMLNRPRVILADEPSGNLDEANTEIMLQHLTDFAKDGGAVLLVTHDAHVAQHADRTLRMDNGKLVNARE